MEKLVEDDTYAGYAQVGGSGDLFWCDVYYKCNVVKVPYVISRSLGNGWIFPKRSALLSMFNVYVSAIKERGVSTRIGNSYAYPILPGMPLQLCKEYDGEAIGINKSFSLFGIIFVGAGFSLLILL